MSSPPPRASLGHVAARASAAVVGSAPLAWTFSWAVASVLPIDAASRALLGMLLPFPSWVAAMCWLFLMRSGARAWLTCALGSAILAAIAYSAVCLRTR